MWCSLKIKMFVSLVACVLLCILITDSFDYVKANADSYECVRLRDCPQLFAMLNDPAQANKANDMIAESICGNDGHLPKVWCSKHQTCRTPDGLSGSCKPLANCKPVAKIMKNETLVNIVGRNYLRSLSCLKTDQHPSRISLAQLPVCCPSDEDEFESRLFPKIELPDPDNNECGTNAYNKITHGKIAELDEYPWTALLHFESATSNDVVRCAGSLISNQYVITAAHCVERNVIRSNGKLNRVTLGEYNTYTETDCIGNACADPVVVAYVESVIIHPDWYSQERQLLNNDIALIRLIKPVNFSTYIKPICLPRANSDVPMNRQLEIAGWGKTEKGITSEVKMKAVVNLYNINSCKQHYRIRESLNIGEGAFCAKGTEGMDSCSGDSGGPVMLRNDNAKRMQVSYLVGLVSFGSDNCGDDTPAVYTKMSKYVDWIKANIRP